MLPNQPAVPAMAVSFEKPARMNMMDRKMRPTRMAAEVLPLVWLTVSEEVDMSVLR